jgi:spore cortex formation protein SpoVR/YcgB (stage V sporulation)
MPTLSIGMPLMYRHWSFGKRFAHDEAFYKRGMRSLAYELVINSDPCINYIMEENSMTMQALVLAHAAFGHNHFFKNNYQFRLWTQPDHIIDYLEFAKRYVAECEERHGQDAVESVLDAAHALMNHGVSRDFRTRPRDVAKREREKAERRRAYEEATYDDIYRTLPEIVRENVSESSASLNEQRRLGLPEREPALFPGEACAQTRGLAGRTLAYCAPAFAIFLSAAPNQDDERGLRDLRAL